MGGGGGRGFDLSPLMNPFGNLFNRSEADTEKQALMNFIEPSGSLGNTMAAFGGSEAQEQMEYYPGGESGKPAIPEPAPIDTSVADAQAAAAAGAAKVTAKKKQRAMAKSSTTYTSPLGITDTADISRKTLLGQ